MSELSDKLTELLHDSNDWLKFAEAKNAILFAFTGAAITATTTVFVATETSLILLRCGLLISTLLLCACSLNCAISFLPKTNLENLLWLYNKPVKAREKKPSDNLHYFGDLQKYSPNDLVNSVSNLYLDRSNTSSVSKEEIDIASQVTINSRIASIKLLSFSLSIYLLIISLLFLLASIIITLVTV